jgi:hypothetical protein
VVPSADHTPDPIEIAVSEKQNGEFHKMDEVYTLCKKRNACTLNPIFSVTLLDIDSEWFFYCKIKSILHSVIRPKKNICVFTVTCQKNLGSVGRD